MDKERISGRVPPPNKKKLREFPPALIFLARGDTRLKTQWCVRVGENANSKLVEVSGWVELSRCR